MAKLGAILIIFGLAAAVLIRRNAAQLTPDDIPEELKYIFELHLENWEPPKELTQMLPYYLSGFDFDNRPIWVVEFGKWDFRHFVEKGEKWQQLVDKYVAKFLLRLYESTTIKSTEEVPVKDGVLIVDFEGFNYRQVSSPASLAFFIQKMRTVVFALPFANDVFVLNVNFVARNVIDLLRPVLGKYYYKVEIYGTNPMSYRPALLKVASKDQLPEWYGGDKDFKPVKVYG